MHSFLQLLNYWFNGWRFSEKFGGDFRVLQAVSHDKNHNCVMFVYNSKFYQLDYTCKRVTSDGSAKIPSFDAGSFSASRMTSSVTSSATPFALEIAVNAPSPSQGYGSAIPVAIVSECSQP